MADGNGICLTHDELQAVLGQKVTEVAREPEYRWGDGFRSFMTDEDGEPVVRLAVTNCAPDMDIWQGLRNPALVGMYPVGLRDVWMHYAAANVRSTRHDGSPNPLAMPEPFEEALGRLNRAVIVSAMLAMNPAVCEAYADKIEQGDLDPVSYYDRARVEVSAILTKSVSKLALSLMSPDRAVVPMTAANAGKVIDRTRSEYLKGRYHGPCNNHYPHSSVAVMTGLMQFGIDRLPFRDEVWTDGSVRRLVGRYASIIIFDEVEPITDGSNGVSLLDAARLAWLRRLSDYSDVADEVVEQRYCPYNVMGDDGTSVCGKCIDFCPSGALANSSPGPDGVFEERLLRQKHRFGDGALDFDFGTCGRDRGQKAQLYDDYVCARCDVMCAARGVCRPAAEIERINSVEQRVHAEIAATD
jgi:ferredoxin